MTYVSAAVACRILGIHAVTLRRWAIAGTISSIKNGAHGKRRYAVDEFIAKNAIKQPSDKATEPGS